MNLFIAEIMKRILSIALCALSLSAFAGDFTIINFNELPAQAQNILKQYGVTNRGIIQTAKDGDGFSVEYEVKGADLSEWEFNAMGKLTGVECASGVPFDLLPLPIQDYITLNHPEATIIEYKIEKKRTEITLKDGLELKFDKEGKFISQEID